ncbi:hypothetical protein PG987_010779 [Apiospora arundinis]
MASTFTIRCAQDPKDFSLWDSHKETFRRLFLTDGLTLAEVKAKMEADHGFPVNNVSTYEVVLRTHFKFRKKLHAGQWLIVDQELDRLKQQGTDCVVTFDMTLSEVVGQGDIKTTKMLLDIGVDPEVKLLPRVEWNARLAARTQWEREKDAERICYLDPTSRAACQGNLHMLGVLSTYDICGDRYIIDALVAASRAWKLTKRQNDPPILDIEKQAATVACLLGTDICQRQIDLQVVPSAKACAVLSTLFPHNTLRKAIQHGFGLNAVQSLVATGEEIHSEKDENGNTLLIDALLTRSKDRYHLVHFLLQSRSDFFTNNSPILKATLWNTALRCSQCLSDQVKVLRLTICPATGRMDEDQDSKVTLDLFNDLLELGVPVNHESPGQTRFSQPLLVLLIQCRADISVIKRVVAAGADINERYDTCAPTALASAITTHQLVVAKWLVEQGQTLMSPGLLIDKGADVDPPYEDVPLSPVDIAIRANTIDVVIMLLTHGLEINQAKGTWRTKECVVDIAAAYGKLDLLKVLIESGGESIYPGISGFDKAFWNAHMRSQPGIIMLLELHTGISVSAVISSLKGRPKELGWVAGPYSATDQ